MKRIIRNIAVFLTTMLVLVIPFFTTNATTEQEILNQKMARYEQLLAKPGTYRIVLVFEKEGTVLEKVISMTVKDDVKKINYTVSANDIVLDVDEAKSFTLDDWVSNANIRIYNETEKRDEIITYVNTDYISYSTGKYDVFFGNENVGGSFVVSLQQDADIDIAVGTGNNETAEETSIQKTESELEKVYKANKEYGFFDGFSVDLATEEKRMLFFLSGIIALFFLITFIFLLIQFLLSNNMLKKVLDFFEKE